nr:hypothetical protein [Bacilli bacterium]
CFDRIAVQSAEYAVWVLGTSKVDLSAFKAGDLVNVKGKVVDRHGLRALSAAHIESISDESVSLPIEWDMALAFSGLDINDPYQVLGHRLASIPAYVEEYEAKSENDGDLVEALLRMGGATGEEFELTLRESEIGSESIKPWTEGNIAPGSFVGISGCLDYISSPSIVDASLEWVESPGEPTDYKIADLYGGSEPANGTLVRVEGKYARVQLPMNRRGFSIGEGQYCVIVDGTPFDPNYQSAIEIVGRYYNDGGNRRIAHVSSYGASANSEIIDYPYVAHKQDSIGVEDNARDFYHEGMVGELYVETDGVVYGTLKTASGSEIPFRVYPYPGNRYLLKECFGYEDTGSGYRLQSKPEAIWIQGIVMVEDGTAYVAIDYCEAFTQNTAWQIDFAWLEADESTGQAFLKFDVSFRVWSFEEMLSLDWSLYLTTKVNGGTNTQLGFSVEKQNDNTMRFSADLTGVSAGSHYIHFGIDEGGAVGLFAFGNSGEALIAGGRRYELYDGLKDSAGLYGLIVSDDTAPGYRYSHLWLTADDQHAYIYATLYHWGYDEEDIKEAGMTMKLANTSTGESFVLPTATFDVQAKNVIAFFTLDELPYGEYTFALSFLGESAKVPEFEVDSGESWTEAGGKTFKTRYAKQENGKYAIILTVGKEA